MKYVVLLSLPIWGNTYDDIARLVVEANNKEDSIMLVARDKRRSKNPMAKAK